MPNGITYDTLYDTQAEWQAIFDMANTTAAQKQARATYFADALNTNFATLFNKCKGNFGSNDFKNDFLRPDILAAKSIRNEHLDKTAKPITAAKIKYNALDFGKFITTGDSRLTMPKFSVPLRFVEHWVWTGTGTSATKKFLGSYSIGGSVTCMIVASEDTLVFPGIWFYGSSGESKTVYRIKSDATIADGITDINSKTSGGHTYNGVVLGDGATINDYVNKLSSVFHGLAIAAPVEVASQR